MEKFSEITKENLIDSLYKIICTANRRDKRDEAIDNDYFKRRVLGFKSEMEFEIYFRENFETSSRELLEGGQFCGSKEDRDLFVYTTVDFAEPIKYQKIYEGISKWSNVKYLYYLKVLNSGWGEVGLRTREEQGGDIKERFILEPVYEIFEFNLDSKTFSKSKNLNASKIFNHWREIKNSPAINPLRARDKFNYFDMYDLKILMKVYATRYFMDVLKRKHFLYFLDIDGFLRSDNEIHIIELKEKTPIKTEGKKELSKKDWKYGWDTRRLSWYQFLEKQLGLTTLYIVRQIETIKEREFNQWDTISLNDFMLNGSWENSVSGGSGRGDTILAPYSKFKSLENYLDSR
ncbi:MAG: hypothetical protein CMK38_04265 [Porticoccaceae bacterium]|nr:hypothetical protein [Porticoccaceae bacterium]